MPTPIGSSSVLPPALSSATAGMQKAQAQMDRAAAAIADPRQYGGSVSVTLSNASSANGAAASNQPRPVTPANPVPDVPPPRTAATGMPEVSLEDAMVSMTESVIAYKANAQVIRRQDEMTGSLLNTYS